MMMMMRAALAGLLATTAVSAAAPEFYAMDSGTASATNPVGLTRPSGIAVGDTMIIIGSCVTSSGASLSASGFTVINSSTGSNFFVGALYKIATSGDTTSGPLDVSFGTVSDTKRAVLLIYKGTSGLAFDMFNRSDTGTTITCNGLTLPSKAVVIRTFSHRVRATGVTGPTYGTQRASFLNSGGSDGPGVHCYEEILPAGAIALDALALTGGTSAPVRGSVIYFTY